MRRVLPWATAGLAVALLVAGVLVFATSEPVRPVDFGWYAYAPLSPRPEVAFDSTLEITFEDDDGAVAWSGGQLLGAGLAGTGLLLLAVLTGWALGRRARAAG